MVYFWVIIVYLIFLLGVGLYRSGSVKTQDDFMVADLPPEDPGGEYDRKDIDRRSGI